jgi:hypothetical protein
MNRLADVEEMEVLHTYEFTSNQAVIFVKTANSWHSVRPMTGQGLERVAPDLDHQHRED